MSTVEESQNRCGQKTALSIFFLLELIAYVFGCIALISPSWQYVYLENGRTEHHHGLWLDCKRDYSHDYGRSREYYETLYRLNRQQSPFDQFFLTSLLCVYKFDYYIDTEDLYDHNHDENRLQDDANQHLLLGWKIASLVALGFAALTASAALLLSVCSFCHRTLICAAAVLVTVAALLSLMGLLIFYIWANYQDNKIIKEEDGVYQQYFGWALYMQVVGTAMQFLASFSGCAVTSMAFRKSRTKLVKIEVADRDNSTLLDQTFSAPLKCSFSAIYRLDSSALQKWEKDYMDIVHSKRISKGSALKSSSKQLSMMSNVNRQLSDNPDLTYEYLPVDFIRNSQSTGTVNKSFTALFADTSLFDQNKDVSNQRIHSESSINVYDKVYEHIPIKPYNHEQSNDYNKDIAICTDKILISSEHKQVSDQDTGRSTVINDVPSCLSASSSKLAFAPSIPETIILPTNCSASTNICQNLPFPSNDMVPRFNTDKTLATTIYAEMQPNAATSNLRDFFVEQNRSFHFLNEYSLNHIPDDIAINTFDLTTFVERERSLGSLNTLGNRTTVEGGAHGLPEAQLYLNLFMNGGIASLLAGSNASDGLTEAKKSTITTV